MSRMVGGSVGLAVMGALVTTIGRSQLDSSLPQLPPAARAQLAGALGSSAVPDGHASPHVVDALHDAFVSALAAGLKVGAAVGAESRGCTCHWTRQLALGGRPSGNALTRACAISRVRAAYPSGV